MAKENKFLEDGWQIGFSIAGGFVFSIVTAFLKSAGIISWSWWIVCAPLILFGVLVFGMLFVLAYWEITSGREDKKMDEDSEKIKILMNLKLNDPKTLKMVTENLNVFGKEYKKMNKKELEIYIDNKKNGPRKKLVEDRTAKLKNLFKGEL